MNLKQVISSERARARRRCRARGRRPSTRAEVKNEVLAARAAGTLMPAGEATEPSYVTPAAVDRPAHAGQGGGAAGLRDEGASHP